MAETGSFSLSARPCLRPGPVIEQKCQNDDTENAVFNTGHALDQDLSQKRSDISTGKTETHSSFTFAVFDLISF
jgi:hypothetical protein